MLPQIAIRHCIVFVNSLLPLFPLPPFLRWRDFFARPALAVQRAFAIVFGRDPPPKLVVDDRHEALGSQAAGDQAQFEEFSNLNAKVVSDSITLKEKIIIIFIQHAPQFMIIILVDLGT